MDFKCDELISEKTDADSRALTVWIMIAERNTWPNGDNDESCWRRSEGVVWREGGVWQKVAWNKDTKR
jgi:hypothetical protein